MHVPLEGWTQVVFPNWSVEKFKVWDWLPVAVEFVIKGAQSFASPKLCGSSTPDRTSRGVPNQLRATKTTPLPGINRDIYVTGIDPTRWESKGGCRASDKSHRLPTGR